MAQTLKAGKHRLAFTAGVNDRISWDSAFSKFVMQSLVRFNRGDWGDVSEEDWKANDADLEALNSGGWYGRILASYLELGFARTYHIWITRNTVMEDGTQGITVLLPSEY